MTAIPTLSPSAATSRARYQYTVETYATDDGHVHATASVIGCPDLAATVTAKGWRSTAPLHLPPPDSVLAVLREQATVALFAVLDQLRDAMASRIGRA